MGLFVVGVAVAAVGVVGDDDVWPQGLDDLHQFADGLVEIGVDEALLLARRRALHARVTPSTGTAEELWFADTQSVQRFGQLTDPVAAELVGVVHGQLRVAVTDDLSLLA